MILGNVNDADKGRAVVSRETRTRRLHPDFPGWGDPQYADFLLPTPAGLSGVVTAVESHGSNPWTRYSVRYADGSRSSGLVPGIDFDWSLV